MAGKKGMKHYGEVIIEEVKHMVEAGKTQREIAEHFGFENKIIIKSLLNRERKKQRLIENGVLPRKKGRPRKNYLPNDCEKDNEIKRLKMENDLLRSFLQNTGRK